MPPALPSKEVVSTATVDASAKIWRAVEAQHVVATLRLTGNDPLAHDLLEELIEQSKPTIPPEAAGLHYLLATPFRYPPRSHGSRFRGAADPGVLYGGLARRTACAEMGYWRWRFVTDSAGLTEIAASPQTLFQSGVRGAAIHLEKAPLDAGAELWTSHDNYNSTQALGRLAREADVALILYRSVRDPEPGVCVAVVHPAALRPKRPLLQETWHLTVTSEGAIWQRESNRFVFRFG
jgi:hypothetical protein